MSDLIGKELGPYRILEQIGTGGMATVYKAYHAAMDRYVAIKVLPEQMSADAELRQRFEQEARVIARLEHTHILPVYDCGQAHNHLYLAMRYIEAGTLKDHMAGRPLALAEANRILQQVSGALDYAHRLGVIHRDIKPSNVMYETALRLDAQGDCYLTDFGLAKVMESSVRLTTTGVGVGTPAYMSPEQGQGERVDIRSDIYSLGVMLYEMVTGQVPYQAETPLAVVFKHITAPLPLPSRVKPGIPEEVERVILKALAKNPADRFQSAGEMAAAFDAAVRLAADESAPAVLPVPPAAQEIAGPSTPGGPAQAVSRLRQLTQSGWGQAAIGLVVGAIALATLGLIWRFVPLQVWIVGERTKSAHATEAVPTAATIGATSAQLATSTPLPIASPTPRPTAAVTASPTPHPTATSTALPSPTPMAAFQLAFTDSFDDDRYRWRPQEYDVGKTEIVDGQFVLRTIYQDSSQRVSDWNTNYLFDEFDLTVHGSIVESPGLSKAAFGIMFGIQADDDFYLLNWTAQGYYALWWLVGSDWTTLVDWTFTGALKSGLNVENEARLTFETGVLAIAFNGREVMRKDLPAYKPGHLGLSCTAYESPGSTCAATEFVAGWREPQPVRVVAGCGCTQQVYEGQEIALRVGWAATTRSQTQDFIDAATPNIWVDDVLLLGGRRADLAPFWQEPVEQDSEWVTYWVYPFGSLKVGTHVLRAQIALSKTVTDGFDSDDDGKTDTFGPGTLDWGTTELVVVEPPQRITGIEGKE